MINSCPLGYKRKIIMRTGFFRTEVQRTWGYTEFYLIKDLYAFVFFFVYFVVKNNKKN